MNEPVGLTSKTLLKHTILAAKEEFIVIFNKHSCDSYMPQKVSKPE